MAFNPDPPTSMVSVMGAEVFLDAAVAGVEGFEILTVISRNCTAVARSVKAV
jgi:hypothetical protein